MGHTKNVFKKKLFLGMKKQWWQVVGLVEVV
jgi:hypothetical protein